LEVEMRQPVLPDNFRCQQQDGFFAFLDDVYDNGPQIAMATAGPGMGKSHGVRQYKEDVAKRHRQRQEARRTIALPEVKERFRAEQCLNTAADRAWLQERWIAMGRRERVSEVELLDMLRNRLAELRRDEDADWINNTFTGRPCPEVVIVTPSQTTTESEMLRLLSYEVTGRASNYLTNVFPPRHYLLEAIKRGNGSWLIIVDEAQRLKPGPLSVVREVYDDAGATVVFVGTPDLEVTLAGRGLESLRSRIAYHYRMDALSVEQVCTLLPGWDQRIVRRIYTHTGGVFRRIENLVHLCEQIRDVNEESKVTGEILDDAIQCIPDLLPGDGKRRVAAPATARVELARPARAATPEAPVSGVAKQATG
jgi:hypothetical protein